MTALEVTQQKSGSQSVPTLAAFWRSHIKTISAGVERPLTRKEFGQLKLLKQCLGSATRDVLDWALNNWWQYASKAAAKAGTGVWPANPTIGFLLAHHTTAMDLLQSAAKKKVIIPKNDPVSDLDKKKAELEAQHNKAIEQADKPTAAQLDKIFAALGTDKEEEVWSEIELENKNKVLAWEQAHGWAQN